MAGIWGDVVGTTPGARLAEQDIQGSALNRMTYMRGMQELGYRQRLDPMLLQQQAMQNKITQEDLQRRAKMAAILQQMGFGRMRGKVSGKSEVTGEGQVTSPGVTGEDEPPTESDMWHMVAKASILSGDFERGKG